MRGVVLSCVLGGWVWSGSAGAITTYHVGNSLTWDSRPTEYEQVAASAGLEQHAGWHIRCGRSLSYIAANPEEVCQPSPGPWGTFAEALDVGEFDAVTFQPHDFSTSAVPSTLSTDRQVILDALARLREDRRNADLQAYLYRAWPRMDRGPEGNDFNAVDWLGAWLEFSEIGPDRTTVLNRGYYDALAASLHDAGEPLSFVPVGDVLAVLAAEHGDNLLPGVSFGETFYRDGIHLSRDIGRVVASMTAFSTLHRVHPRFIGFDYAGYFSGFREAGEQSRLTPALREVLAETVWSVVSAMPETGVPSGPGLPPSDVLRLIGQEDLNTLLLDWGAASGQAELNEVLLKWGRYEVIQPPVPLGQAALNEVLLNWGSEGVGQSALNDVILNWGQPETVLESTAVPEPAVGALVLLGLGCVPRRVGSAPRRVG